MLFRAVWILLVLSVPSSPLQVFWNVPTEECPPHIKFDLSEYGIIQNEGDSFLGSRMNTLYRPGLWPQYYDNGTAINGGIPHRGNLSLHLMHLREDIQRLIPAGYKGPAVIDFEQWLTTLRSTGNLRYRRIAKEDFRKQEMNRAVNRKGIRADDTVASVFERASRPFLEETLLVAREERPDALWGYYHYPYCKNYLPRVDQCAPAISEDNTKAQWLYDRSVALYPSVYLRRDWSAWINSIQTRVILEETERLGKAAGGRPVYPFTWYNYHKAGVTDYMEPADLLATVGQVVTRQPDGLIIWGASDSVATPQLCRLLQEYVFGRLGPFVKFMTGLPSQRLQTIRKNLESDAGSFYGQVSSLLREGAFGVWSPPPHHNAASFSDTGGVWTAPIIPSLDNELSREELILM